MYRIEREATVVATKV